MDDSKSLDDITSATSLLGILGIPGRLDAPASIWNSTYWLLRVKREGLTI